MNDQDKTEDEFTILRRRVVDLKASGTEHQRTEKMLQESEKGIGSMERISSYLLRSLAAIPVPAFIALIATLAILDIRVMFEPSLLPLLDTVFVSVIAIIVAYLSAKSYLRTGSLSSSMRRTCNGAVRIFEESFLAIPKKMRSCFTLLILARVSPTP